MVAWAESRTAIPEPFRPRLSRFRTIPIFPPAMCMTGLPRANSRRMNTCEKRVCKSFRFNTYKNAIFNPLWNQHLQKNRVGGGDGLGLSNQPPHQISAPPRKLFHLFRTNPVRPLRPSLLGARIGPTRGTSPLSPVSNSTDSGPWAALLPRNPKSAKGPRLFLAGRMIRPSWRGASREAGRKGRQCPIG